MPILQINTAYIVSDENSAGKEVPEKETLWKEEKIWQSETRNGKKQERKEKIVQPRYITKKERVTGFVRWLFQETEY